MVGTKQGSAQLCSPAGKGYSAFPLPHIPPFSLIPHHSHRLFVACAFLVPVWHAMATPTSPGRDKGNLPPLSHHSVPRLSVSAVQGSPSETPWHVFHKLMPLLPGKGCVLPAHPSSIHGTASQGDEEMNVPRHQGDLGVTNARCNLQK